MATTTEPKSGQFLEFDEFIDYQLEKTRSSIRWTDVAAVAASVAVATLGYFLSVTIADHWLTAEGLSMTARGILLVVFLVGLCVTVAQRLIFPLFRRVHRLYAAQQIERAEPGLRSLLLSLIDLRGSGHAVNPSVVASIERQAAIKLQNVDIARAVNHRPLIHMLYGLLGVAVILFVYSLTSPKRVSFSRVFLPVSAAPLATRTQILDVTPGDTEVLARSQLVVTADLGGEIPDEVTVVVTAADRTYVNEPIKMRADEDVSKRFSAVLAGHNGGGVVRDFTYRIVAGDARGEVYNVHVVQPPSAEITEIHYLYPTYMQLAEKSQSNSAIDAWEGTRVTLKAQSTVPVASATMQFSDEETFAGKLEEMPMQVRGTGIQCSWSVGFREDGTYARFYRIQCATASGQTDPDPAVHTLVIRPDQAPEILLVDPADDLDAPANAVIPILAAVRDPDFELGYVNLCLEKAGDLIRRPLADGGVKSATIRQRLDLSDFNYEPGDRVLLWVEAYDNRQPNPNRGNSRRIAIRITDSVTEDQVEERLAEDEQRQAELLDAAEQAANPDRGDVPNEDNADAAEDMAEGEQRPEATPVADAEREPAGNDQADPNAATDKQNENGKNDDAVAERKPFQNDGRDDAEVLRTLHERFSDDNGGGAGEQESQESSGEEKRGPKDGESSNDDAKPGDAAAESRPDPNGTGESRKQDSEPKGSDPGSRTKEMRKGAADSSESAPQSGTPDTGDNPPSDPKQPDPSGTGRPSTEGTRPDTKGSETPGSKGDAPGEKPGPAEPMPKEPGTSPDGKPSTESPNGDAPSDKPQNDGMSDSANVKNPGNDGNKPDDMPSDSGAKNPAMSKDAGADAGTEGESAEDGTSEKGQGTSSQPGKNDKSGSSKSETGESTDGKGTDSASPAKPGQQAAPDGKADMPTAGENSTSGKPGDKPTQNRNGTPTGDDRPAMGDGRKDGQSSDNPQSGEAGGSSQASDGNPGSKESGAGDSSSKPGSRAEDNSKSGDKGGSPGSKSGDSGKSSDSGSPKSGGSQSGDAGSKGSRGSESGSPSSKSGGDASGGESSQGGKDGGGEMKAKQDDPAAKGDKSPDARDQKGDPSDEQNPQGDGGSGKSGGGGQEPKGEAGGGKSSPEDSKADESGQPSKTGDQSGSQEKSSKSGESGGEKSGGEKAGGDSGKQGGKKQGGEGGSESGGEGGDGGGESKGGSPSGSPNSTPSTGSKAGAGNVSGENTPGSGSSGGGLADGTPDGASTADDVNVEDAREAANLVLKRLENELERGQVDEQLLKDLGWTEDDLREFSRRLEQQLADPQRDVTPESAAKRRQFEEMLKNLDLSSQGADRKGSRVRSRPTEEIDVRRAPVPAEYREAYEAFTRGLSRRPPTPRSGR